MKLGAMLAVAAVVSAGAAAAVPFTLKEVADPTRLAATDLKPRTIYFSDRKDDPLVDPGLRLAKFEDWAAERPLERRWLALYPTYAEPTIQVTAHGLTKPYKEKLHLYMVEARFVLDRAPEALDLGALATLDVVKKLDPSIKHRVIGQDEVIPLKDDAFAYNRNPDRRWCEPGPGVLCVQSRYQLEGKLPTGVRLANKLEEGGKKIDDFIEFQSELRAVPAEAVQGAEELAQLTRLATPVAGVIEQNIFWVNEVMQFGKLLGVFQADPNDPRRTVVTAFLTIGVETDVLEKKREFESIPILRNLVPSQVLLGNSSFNVGTSISAGLPEYTRGRVKAIAGILDGG